MMAGLQVKTFLLRWTMPSIFLRAKLMDLLWVCGYLIMHQVIKSVLGMHSLLGNFPNDPVRHGHHTLVDPGCITLGLQMASLSIFITLKII